MITEGLKGPTDRGIEGGADGCALGPSDPGPLLPGPLLSERRELERQKYVRLARTRYGRTNHGRWARELVLGWQPEFVVDLGCGRNDFIREMRRCGIDGLGVDFAIGGADIVAPLHAIPLLAGAADVVTSFDALEHLLPEDVPLALAEMRRIGRSGGRFVFSVSLRPSRITVGGANLHPTVRPLAWWQQHIAGEGVVETVEQRGSAGRLVGTWL